MRELFTPIREYTPSSHEVIYEIVADMGEDGKKTIFSTNSYSACLKVVNEMNRENISNVSMSEQEFKALTGISVNVVLVVRDTEIATAELFAYKVKNTTIENENITYELCPHCESEVVLENKFVRQVCLNVVK